MADEQPIDADPKHILQSKVFWGVVIALVGKYVPQLISIPELPGDIAALLGSALAIYGRFQASRPVTVSISRPSNFADITPAPTPTPKPIDIDGGPVPGPTITPDSK